MPILETLKSLLSHPQIKDEYFKSVSTNISIDSFYTSSKFQTNQLFKNKPNSIQIKLYIDEFGTSDPLGDSKNNYKITGVYYKIGNLPYRFQGTNHFTQLAMLFFPEDLKRLGYDEMFSPLIKDIKFLETQGIDIEFNNQIVNLKGSISYLVADSLAANSIGGYIESFSSNVSGNYFFNLIQIKREF